MRSADGIGVGQHEQSRRLDRSHVFRPVIVLAQQLAELGEPYGPICQARRDASVGLIYGTLLHLRSRRPPRLRHGGKDSGVPSVALKRSRANHQLSDHVWTLEGCPQGYAAAERIEI